MHFSEVEILSFIFCFGGIWQTISFPKRMVDVGPSCGELKTFVQKQANSAKQPFGKPVIPLILPYEVVLQ